MCSPGRAPGGTAKIAEPVCLRYSISASSRASVVLHRDELRARVADEGEEEQAGVEAAEAVAAVGEVVAAAQQPRAAVVVGVGEADVGVGGDRAARRRALQREVGLGELVAAGQRRALALVAADDRLLLAQRAAVPGLDVHVDPAGDEVGAAGASSRRRGSSPAATQTCSSSASGSSALTLAVPSLKPNRLRGVAWLVDVDDVRPKPSCDQRTATVPKPMRARLRMAWTATWGSSAQACTHRSPPRAGRVEGVGREVRQRRSSAAGRRSARPKRSLAVGVVEQRRPEPERDASARTAAGPSASPVSSGGAWYGAARPGRTRPGRLALRHPGRRGRSTPAAGRRARRGSSW